MNQPAVLAIDPGYATIGWCLFREGPAPADAVDAVRLLLDWSRIKPVGPRPARLLGIYEIVDRLIRHDLWGPRSRGLRVVVELPAIAGRYRRHQGGGAEVGVHDLLLATGAIMASAAGAVARDHVFTMRAPAGKWARKDRRHAWLRTQFEEAGKAWPVGERGGALPDVYDAAWLGVQMLRTPQLAEETA